MNMSNEEFDKAANKFYKAGYQKGYEDGLVSATRILDNYIKDRKQREELKRIEEFNDLFNNRLLSLEQEAQK